MKKDAILTDWDAKMMEQDDCLTDFGLRMKEFDVKTGFCVKEC